MNEISKNLVCICLRAGMQIWIEKDRAERFIDNLEASKEHKFVRIGDELVNTADLSGIFSPQTMEEYTRRNNGQWKCEYGNWHEKREQCTHWKPELKNFTGTGI